MYVTEKTLCNVPAIAPREAALRQAPKEAYRGEFHMNVLCFVVIESSTVLYFSFVLPPNGNAMDILYFIPVSFGFEVIFDFFHYITHYTLHKFPYLYKHSHKKHHKFQYPSAITTFYQDPADILFTNVMPVSGTVYIMTRFLDMSFYTFSLITMYKTYVEIYGHTGKALKNTSSFPQCIWLPRALGIQLRVDDHDAHHSKNTCNYAKRFSLWDKVFNTYNTHKKSRTLLV
jgi:sterol desaturase/sphingolipid hydroxylase (fatty acid hydroxylase superfamily)